MSVLYDFDESPLTRLGTHSTRQTTLAIPHIAELKAAPQQRSDGALCATSLHCTAKQTRAPLPRAPLNPPLHACRLQCCMVLLRDPLSAADPMDERRNRCRAAQDNPIQKPPPLLPLGHKAR